MSAIYIVEWIDQQPIKLKTFDDEVENAVVADYPEGIMKSLSVVLALVVLLLFPLLPASAQPYNPCADVDLGGSVNVADLVRMLDVYLGGPSLPAGKGDIDYRQNFNLGDVRMMAGYLFMAYPEGGCPPFSAYTLLDSPDSLYLPQIAVPDGSGSISAPIVMNSNEPVSDLLITARLVAANCSASIDSVTFINWQADVHQARIVGGNELTVLLNAFFAMDRALQPGVRAIVAVHISYSASSGGSIRLEPADFGAPIFTHQVYGDFQSINYDVMKIGIPRVSVRETVALAHLGVAPDSLNFAILHGSGNPDPQTFEVSSDGGAFAWSATSPAWLTLNPTLGISGTTVSVQAVTDGLSPGTYTGTIVVSAAEALNSPKQISVVLRVLPQFPAFDANCDGAFSISDIVLLIQYIFGGRVPCNPWTGQPLGK